MYVAGAVRKLVRAQKADIVHFYVVAVAVCKNSTHDMTLGSVCLYFMAREFKPAEFHATCCEDKILSPQQTVFAKTGM